MWLNLFDGESWEDWSDYTWVDFVYDWCEPMRIFNAGPIAQHWMETFWAFTEQDIFYDVWRERGEP